jgi:peptide subunit release factor 1 (eRF1)
VADRLGALLAQGSWLGIVLGGPARVTNEQVRFLPSVLQHRVLSAVHLNPTALPEQKIREVSLAARDVAHQRRTAARVEEYETALGNGWAVSGARASLRALADGQARVLLVRAGLSGNGFRCAASGRLTMAATDCRGEGEPVPVRDVVDEAIEDAMRQRVEVVVVDDLSVGGKLDGLGAVLRFRSPARAKAAPAPRSSVPC